MEVRVRWEGWLKTGRVGTRGLDWGTDTDVRGRVDFHVICGKRKRGIVVLAMVVYPDVVGVPHPREEVEMLGKVPIKAAYCR